MIWGSKRPKHGLEDVSSLIEIRSGHFDPHKLSLFSIFRDEIYFVKAFLTHYRSIGIEQFLIFDDGSEDGTYSALCAEPDVVVLTGIYRFGQEVDVVFPDAAQRKLRAGTYYKCAITWQFFAETYALYADADEFLLLPSGVFSLHEVIDHLQARQSTAILASVVELFPDHLENMIAKHQAPENFVDLITRYGYFEPHPLIKIMPDTPKPRFVGAAKTQELFERFDIGRNTAASRKGLFGLRKTKTEFKRTARHKTPIFRYSADHFMVGSHHGTALPDSKLMLCMAHFVFTEQFYNKAMRAISWKGHAAGAEKYAHYLALYDTMRENKAGFLSDTSQKYTGAISLRNAGLMHWFDNI